MKRYHNSVAGLIVAVASAALLAGCSGGAQMPSTGHALGMALTAPARTAQQPLSESMHGRGCPSNDGVKVMPCVVVFDSQHAGPTNVVVQHGGGGGRLLERDNCASRGIATIAQAGRDAFTVTAGAAAGACGVHFEVRNGGRGGPGGHNDDMGGGGPQLRVVNRL